jgi:transposase
LLAADGLSNSEIAERVGVSRPTVIEWRKRYRGEGSESLWEIRGSDSLIWPHLGPE